MDPDEFDFVADEPLDFAEGEPLPGSAEMPAGYREQGARVHVLPGFRMSAGGGMEQEPGEGHTEVLVEKAPSAHDVAPGTQVGPDLRTTAQQIDDFRRSTAEEMTGRSPVTAASLRRALEAYRAAPSVLEGADAAMRTALPTAPMPPGTESEPDRRPQAVWRGVGQAALFGLADEAGAQFGGVPRPWLGEGGSRLYSGPQSAPDYETRRDALRSEMAQSEAQAPAGHALGQAIGSAPLMMLPGGQATAGGRIATQAAYGAGLGALRGAGESEAEAPGGVALDSLTGAGLEGAAGGFLGAAGEVVGPALRSVGRWAERMAPQTRLEATGIWGSAAMRAASERPGGQAALAADLRRLGIGHDIAGPSGRRALTPRSERVFDDAAEVRDVAGSRMAAVVEQMDAGGPGTVDLGNVAEQMEAIAREYDRVPVGGADVARTLRERIVEPLRTAGRVSFSEAHRQRQVIDDMIRSWSGEPNLTTAAGRLRTARRGIAQAMEAATEQIDPALRDAWRRANRDYSVARFVQERGRGAERLSVGGGMGGAVATGVETAMGGLPGAVRGVAGRELAQQQRMLWPGVRTAGLEALAETLGQLGTPAGQRYSAILRSARERIGLPAAHFLLMRTRPDYRALFGESNVDSGEEPQEQQP